MALKHDANGFLVGETIPELKRLTKGLDSIRKDVAAIKQLLQNMDNQAAPSIPNALENSAALSLPLASAPALPPSISSVSNHPRTTNNRITNNAGGSQRQTVEPQQTSRNTAPLPALQTVVEPQASHTELQSTRADSTASLLSEQLVERQTTVIPAAESDSSEPPTRQRDANGRFISGGNTQETVEPTGRRRNARGQFESSGSDDKEAEKSFVGSAIDNLGDKISGVLAFGTGGLEEADPAVKAFQEVAEPLSRGYQFLFGGNGEDKKDKPYFAWFGKILKSLKKTEENTGEENSDGGGGGFFSLLAGLMGGGLLGLLGLIFSPIALGIGAAGLLAWGVFSKTGREFFANLGPNLMAAWQWSVKAFNDYVIPAVIATWDFGVRFFNETIAPALTASWDWLTQQISDIWTGFTTWIGEIWDGALKGIQPIFDAIGKKWDSFIDSITKIWDKVVEFVSKKVIEPVANAVGAVKDAHESAVNSTTNGIENTVNTVTGAHDSAVNAVTDGIEGTVNAAGAAKDAVSGGYEKAKNYVTGNESLSSTAKKKWGDKKFQSRWQEAKPLIADAANKAGVDPAVLAKIAGFESGFNSEAMPITKSGKKLSSAHGYGQFLDGTWDSSIKKYGKKYGLDTSDPRKYRHDKQVQANMLAEFTKENLEKGRKYGGTDDAANVYAMHNLGEGDGPKFLKALKANPNAPVSSVLSGRVIKGNGSLYKNGNISLSEAYANMGSAMAGSQGFANDISGGTNKQKQATAEVAATTPKTASASVKPAQPVDTAKAVSPLMTNINNNLVQGTQQAINKGVKYNYGSKNSSSGSIDCSGWIMELNRGIASQMTDPKLMKPALNAMEKGANEAGGAGIIEEVGKLTGKELSGKDVNLQNLKEGMLIGIDYAQGGAKSGEGRYKGIDHITQVVKDPTTGAMQISESSSKKGVHTTDAGEWLAKRSKKMMYAVDPYANVRNGKAENVPPPLAKNADPATKPVATPKQVEQATAKPVLPTQNVTPAMPSVSFIAAKPQPIQDAPAITVPLASSSRSAPQPIIRQEIGQDLPDRKLAHIATGGLSSP